MRVVSNKSNGDFTPSLIHKALPDGIAALIVIALLFF